MIREMRKTTSFVEKNIFKSVENFSADTVTAYKRKGGAGPFSGNL